MAASHQWTKTIKPVLPYNFKFLTQILSKFPYPVMNHASYNSIKRVFYDDDHYALVSIGGVGSPDDAELDLVLLASAGDMPEDQLLEQIRFVLSTEIDRSDFFEYVRHKASVWEFMRSLYGVPVLRTATLFEALICVIIEQHIKWDNALRAQTWLLAWGGRGLQDNGKTYYAFPTVFDLAQATHDDLLPLKITHRRIELIQKIALDVLSGALDLEALKQLPPQDCYERLKEMKGIGHWTAAVATMRATGNLVFIPDNDVALQAATNFYFYGKEVRKLKKQKLLRAYLKHGDHAGALAHYTLLRWVYDVY